MRVLPCRVASHVLFTRVPGCSSASTSEGPVAGSSGAPPPAITASELGGVCSGGCGWSACALPSSDCKTGICGYDLRFGEEDRWLGCTADCTSRACPPHWEC